MSSKTKDQNKDMKINDITDIPPDGGRQAWTVLFAAFICNGTLFGILNSYGVIYRQLDALLKKNGVENSESKAALVGTLGVGMSYMLSALVGLCSAILGLRATAVLGGTIVFISLVLSSFAVPNVTALYFTHGLLYGVGASMGLTPALSILGHYFKKYLGFANGIVTVGESFFTFIIPFLLQYTIENHGLKAMFRVLAVLALSVAVGGLAYRPMPSMVYRATGERSFKALLETSFNFEIWRNPKYRLWCASMAVGLMGQFVPFVHLGKFVEVTFTGMHSHSLNIPIQCLAAGSMVGRLLFGSISDLPNVDTILVQQIACYILGSLTIILPFIQWFILVCVVALGIGLCEGAFIAVVGPIATELCGVAHAPHGIGFMMAVTSIPYSGSPTIASHLYSVTHSYNLPFVLAGVWPLFAASLMFGMKYPCFAFCGRKESKDPSTEPSTSSHPGQ